MLLYNTLYCIIHYTVYHTVSVYYIYHEPIHYSYSYCQRVLKYITAFIIWGPPHVILKLISNICHSVKVSTKVLGKMEADLESGFRKHYFLFKDDNCPYKTCYLPRLTTGSLEVFVVLILHLFKSQWPFHFCWETMTFTSNNNAEYRRKKISICCRGQ